MFGAHINTLNVYQQVQNGAKTLLWTRAGTQGNIWNQGQKTIQPSNTRFQVKVENIFSFISSFSSIHLIDEIATVWFCNLYDNANENLDFR